MHFVLVGPGALGCLLGSRLFSAGNDSHQFTLIDHNQERARSLTASGIIYTSDSEEFVARIPVSSSPAEVGHADVVILCVKSYDIKRCLDFCSPLFEPDTLLLFMQNGIAHLDVAGHTGKATPLYGTTTEGATLIGTGRVRHGGRGLTQLGTLGVATSATSRALAQIVDCFEAAGLKSKVADDILSRLWTKLLVNAGINGLTAIHDCRNGELLDSDEVAQRMAALVNEAREVAVANGIEVPAEPLEITREVCRKTAGNVSSMLQDVRQHRRTEIDAINGMVVEHGRRLGISVTENRRLVQQVKALENTYLQAARP